MAKTITSEPVTPTINIIATGTVIKGDIKANGDIRVDGQVIGNLIVQGRIVVGGSGQVEGEIHCQNGDFSGEVKGKVFVSELLTIRSTASINGDIQTQKISIEPGAVFTGNCSMQEQQPEIQ
ncbi:MAG: polymer-forming cytoskeletal protein [Bacteroidales bacterium]|jgi:cytoskeletal protein CcmA (bactofilin family)|nr:polymer-forming cytoskeletal protein [Bacteroidales bacterium]